MHQDSPPGTQGRQPGKPEAGTLRAVTRQETRQQARRTGRVLLVPGQAEEVDGRHGQELGVREEVGVVLHAFLGGHKRATHNTRSFGEGFYQTGK